MHVCTCDMYKKKKVSNVSNKLFKQLKYTESPVSVLSLPKSFVIILFVYVYYVSALALPEFQS